MRKQKELPKGAPNAPMGPCKKLPAFVQSSNFTKKVSLLSLSEYMFYTYYRLLWKDLNYKFHRWRIRYYFVKCYSYMLCTEGKLLFAYNLYFFTFYVTWSILFWCLNDGTFSFAINSICLVRIWFIRKSRSWLWLP